MIKKVKIGNKLIGDREKCFVIAEAGSNHDMKFEQALELIDIAVEAKADAVKFQVFSADNIYSVISSYYNTTKKLELPREWLGDLSNYCKKKGIIFLCTPFDLPAVDALEVINAPAYKISSLEIIYMPLLLHIAKTGKTVILSTGTANLSDIKKALEFFYRCNNNNIILLHCVSNYPAKYEDLNLRAMETMRQAFQLPVGFSDHSLGITADIVAVSLGANVIEKHFTINRKLKGPDHSFSLEPNELKSMVQAIRDTENMFGSSVKRRTESEEEIYKIRRKYNGREFCWRRD